MQFTAVQSISPVASVRGKYEIKKKMRDARWRRLLASSSWFLNKTWNNGYLSGCVMSIFFACTSLFGKALEDHMVPALQILAMRGAITLPLLWAGLQFLNVTPMLGRRELWHLLALQGFLYAVLVAGEWSSFALMHLADTEAIVRISVVFGAFLGWALKGDPLGWPTLTGMMICVVGTAFITQPPMLFGGVQVPTWNPNQVVGIAFAFLSAIFSAFQAAVVGLIDKNEGSIACVLWINIGIFTLASTVMTVANWAVGWPGPPVLNLSASDWGALWGVIITVLLGEVYAIRMFQQLSTALGLSFSNLAVILMAIGGWIFLGEVLSLYEIAGITMVLVGIVVMSQERSKGDSCTIKKYNQRAAGNAELKKIQLLEAGPLK